jgi:Sulfatase
MGYRTPNIDRIAKEGMKFTDSYGEQSCTAGRAGFITGQGGYRTGLTKVGIPGSDSRVQEPFIRRICRLSAARSTYPGLRITATDVPSMGATGNDRATRTANNTLKWNLLTQ